MAKVRESEGKDSESIGKVNVNWTELKRLCEIAGPIAMNYEWILEKMQGRSFMGKMEDYFGPPSEKF